VRHSAAVELSHFFQPEADRLLAGAARDDDPLVANTAAHLLLERGWQPQKAIEKRRLDIAKLENLTHSGNPDERKQALLTLARMEDPCALCGPLTPDVDEVVRQLSREAEPHSLRFLMYAARNYSPVAEVAVRGLLTLANRHRTTLTAAQLRELSDLEDVDQSAPRPATAGSSEYLVIGKIRCKSIRDLARKELTRRESEQEKRKKYFCPDCSHPLRVEKKHLGRRIICPQCRKSHLCSTDNFC
jgi:DNA-directed RNA polymerase subunit RPC12/RpoP